MTPYVFLPLDVRLYSFKQSNGNSAVSIERASTVFKYENYSLHLYDSKAALASSMLGRELRMYLSLSLGNTLSFSNCLYKYSKKSICYSGIRLSSFRSLIRQSINYIDAIPFSFNSYINFTSKTARIYDLSNVIFEVFAKSFVKF